MRMVIGLLSGALLGAGLLGSVPAQAAGEPEVSPTGKGIAGGALLGAEALLLLEAAVDVQPTWLYWLGGLGGAAVGGVGGYFVENSGDARLSMLLLAGGMALAIPTTVAVLSATAYKPPRDYVQDRPPADEPLAEPPQPMVPPAPVSPPPRSSFLGTPGASGKPPRFTPLGAKAHVGAHLLVPRGLLAFRSEVLTLNLPSIEVKRLFSRAEVSRWGLRQGTEVRVPVLSLLF